MKKKYGNGTGRLGSSYIEDPATALAKNSINIAKAQQSAADNNLLPILTMMGGLLSQGASMFGKKEGEDSSTENPLLTSTQQGIAAFGSNGNRPIDEVEGGEVVETPDGQTNKIKGASHENGGVDVTMPSGTRVYSKRLEKFGESMADRKLKRENRKANLEKLLTKSPNDLALKNSHSRSVSILDAEEEEDLRMQEMYGMLAGVAEFAYGTGPDGTDDDLLGVQDDDLINKYNSGNPILSDFLAPAQNDISGDAASGSESPNNLKSSLAGLMPMLGNAVGLGGNMISTFGPMRNTLASRASDTPNINAFENFGKDAIDANLESMEFAASQKASSLNRIRSQANGAKRAGRNSARGVNQMRALDLATEMNVNEANQGANDSFSRTMMELMNAKSQLENMQDSAVMQGEAARDMNDRKDKDNFYTNRGKDIATMGEGIQRTGKDINAVAQNEMIMKMINQLSKYGIGFDKEGNLIDQNKTK